MVLHYDLQDAWLDGIDANKSYPATMLFAPVIEDNTPDLSSDDVGNIKRRIANILEPSETVRLSLLFCHMLH